jgi:integrase/recombinase XerC
LHYNDLSLKEISASVVRSWLASLKEESAASKTINRKISTLKSFFKYQLKINNIECSPMTSVSSLKMSRRLPSFIEQQDINTLFKYVDFPQTWQGKTNYLLLVIFYETGIRLSELINLKESQVDKSNGAIKVLGKGNKERVIPVNNRLLQQVDEYISARKLLFSGEENAHLLVSKTGKALKPRYVYNIVKKYLGGVSTNERKSPHILRHSFATHLTSNGAGINAIKELLGHSSLASTQIYTHNSIEKLKEVHKLAHPKS